MCWKYYFQKQRNVASLVISNIRYGIQLEAFLSSSKTNPNAPLLK